MSSFTNEFQCTYSANGPMTQMTQFSKKKRPQIQINLCFVGNF